MCVMKKYRLPRFVLWNCVFNCRIDLLLRCSTQVKVTKMTGLGSQLWSDPQVYEFPLPSDIVPLSTSDEDGGKCHTPGFNFVNSQGLAYEAAEVNRCLSEGLIETPLFSTAQCIEVLRIISDIREYASKGMS